VRLTDEELRDVYARAEEIERGGRQGGEWNAELAAVIGAGEEVGLSRQAIERGTGGAPQHFHRSAGRRLDDLGPIGGRQVLRGGGSLHVGRGCARAVPPRE